MQELNKWFDDLSKLIQDSFITYKHLSVIKELNAETKFLNEDFFVFFQYQQWFMLTIQLSKIFECKPRTQKRNIITFCNKIIKGDYKEEFEFILLQSKCSNPLSYADFVEKANQIRTKIKLNQVAINKIINVRNKVYAHTDIERKIDFPTIEEVKSIIDLASFSYNNLRGFMYGISTDFSRGINNLTMKDVVRIMQRGLSKKE
ncbi:AbiU2 domain-containing protein [Aquiflexum lacus]|uniref:AbiU2 domain-containing protein n=1 Tax=Aquiflexum lacus TaxID=2483805 RepID=UPI0018953FCE|nr:hypothetical protein [Aquiflexum lacus]